jgi:hypothetical protein
MPLVDAASARMLPSVMIEPAFLSNLSPSYSSDAAAERRLQSTISLQVLENNPEERARLARC